jgi:hypothetical protein
VVVEVTINSESSGTVRVWDKSPVENVWMLSGRSALDAPGNSVWFGNVAMSVVEGCIVAVAGIVEAAALVVDETAEEMASLKHAGPGMG